MCVRTRERDVDDAEHARAGNKGHRGGALKQGDSEGADIRTTAVHRWHNPPETDTRHIHECGGGVELQRLHEEVRWRDLGRLHLTQEVLC